MAKREEEGSQRWQGELLLNRCVQVTAGETEGKDKLTSLHQPEKELLVWENLVFLLSASPHC